MRPILGPSRSPRSHSPTSISVARPHARRWYRVAAAVGVDVREVIEADEEQRWRQCDIFPWKQKPALELGSGVAGSVGGARQAVGVVRLSRHAKNEMRLYGIDDQDVEATIKAPAKRESDERSNARLSGETADGRPILVVVAADDPEFVITAFLRS
jgi:hypothetical protein